MQNYFHQIKPKSTFINAIRARYWKAVSDPYRIPPPIFFFLSIFERHIACVTKNRKGRKRREEKEKIEL